MPRISLIYASALQNEQGIDLPDMLESLVRDNEQHAIDSLTLFARGNILQVIEGEEAAIMRTMQTLTQDPRHSLMTTMAQETVERRNLIGTSLGHLRMSQRVVERFAPDAPVFKAAGAEIDRRVQPCIAHSLLHLFIAQHT
jgi:hypothetical protein